MRNPERRLPAVTAAAVLAALASTGCGAPRETPGINRPPEPVCVIVMYDDVAKTAVMSHKTVTVREGKDWLLWASPDGIVRVDFGKDSPFDKEPKHEKKVLKSDSAKKGTAGKGFDYTAVLELPDGTKVDVDPRIEVIP